MSNLSLFAWDRLLILEAHTASEPQKLIQKCMSLGGLNPEKALQNAITKLRSKFESNIRIANALYQRLDSFPPIRSVYDVEKLKELLDICEYIEVNISCIAEFHVVNSAYGARKVWFKLVEALQNLWRSICEDHRSRYGDVYLPFSDFVLFLPKKTSGFFDSHFPQPNHVDNKRKTSLKTSPTSPVENSKVSPISSSTGNASQYRSYDSSKTTLTRNQKSCPLHEGSNHTLTSCRKFEKIPHKEKIQIVRDNKLCYTCLGSHLRQNCTSNVKCEKCQGNTSQVYVCHITET